MTSLLSFRIPKYFAYLWIGLLATGAITGFVYAAYLFGFLTGSILWWSDIPFDSVECNFARFECAPFWFFIRRALLGWGMILCVALFALISYKSMRRVGES